jgi:hypothetical protein
MYPHTEDAPGDRRQVDVDEHPRDDQLDARRDEQYGETPAGQRDSSTGETADPDRTYGEPASDQDRPSGYGEPASDQDTAGDQEGYAEPERAERPGGDLRDEPAAAPTNGASADRPAYASTGVSIGPTQRAPQSTDDWQLFGTEDADGLRSRWTELQGTFVDDPRQAVEQAERLVSEVVQTLTDRFDERKKELQTQGESPDTEELRLAMVRYRTFFRQLLGG